MRALIAVAAIVTVTCAYAAETIEEPLVLTISTHQERYVVGEDVILTATLLNKTKDAVTIWPPVATYNFNLDVARVMNDGTKVHLKSEHVEFEANLTKDSFQTIPGITARVMMFSLRKDFRSVYDQMSPGHYEIQAVYENLFDYYYEDARRIEIETWIGTVLSDTITLDMVE